MEISEPINGAQAVVSPCGRYIASSTDSKVRIYHSLNPNRYSELSTRVPQKDLSALKWNEDSSRLLIFSHRLIEVITPTGDAHKIRIDNGTSSLGKFQSAHFIGTHVLTIWEFGKAKLWDLDSGVGFDLTDLKTTCDHSSWQSRPQCSSARSLAFLSRPGAEDTLTLFAPSSSKLLDTLKLNTIDAQGLSWSPNGRWLAIIDTPISAQGVHIHTATGHHFRSYSSATDANDRGLGVKATVWSGDSRILALTRFDGKIELLNTRTFAPFAFIDQPATIQAQQYITGQSSAHIWQENVSASNHRSYSAVTHDLIPPLSQAKPSGDPKDSGVSEAHFSCDGEYLATSDKKRLSTVLIWSTSSLSLHIAIVQHNSVRRLHWHPTQRNQLLIDCGENICYFLDVDRPEQPPLAALVGGRGLFNFSWVSCEREKSNPAVLAASRSSFLLLHPQGRTQSQTEDPATSRNQSEEPEEDSLLEALTGHKAEQSQSYTEQISIEADAFSSSHQLDDTFIEKHKPRDVQMEIDPLDDSQIF